MCEILKLFYYGNDSNLFSSAAQESCQKGKRLRDSILSPFFHSYIFAMYKNEALWI